MCESASSDNDSIPIINEDEFIDLQQIGTGTIFIVDLSYWKRRIICT